MANSIPSNFLVQAESMLRAWRELDPKIKFGSLSLADLETAVKNSRDCREEIATFKTLMKDRRQSLGRHDTKTWDIVKRGRSGSKSQFGDDSKEYAMFGGKRQSERKPPTRRAPKSSSS